MKYKVSLSAVNVPGETYKMMEEALIEGKIGQTDLIEQFEELISRYVGAKYCIAVCSGTMADAVAIAAMRNFFGTSIKKVVVPALTFIAQPNSVRYNNLEVVFADVKEDWTINTSELDIPHVNDLVFGTALMGRYASDKFYEIEDACEAFGSKYHGKFVGTFAEIGTYSFFPSHTISTGEGGAIVTDNEKLAYLCRSIRSHGTTSSDPRHKFHFPNFGFNARMSSLNAVLGICLMKHIDEYVTTRHNNFIHMQKRLGGFEERPDEFIIPHGFPIGFRSESARNRAMDNILEAGIECRKFFSCIPHEEVPYMQFGDFPIADHLSHTYLYVPCHQNMSVDDVEYVCDIVRTQEGKSHKMVKHHGDGTQPKN